MISPTIRTPDPGIPKSEEKLKCQPPWVVSDLPLLRFSS